MSKEKIPTYLYYTDSTAEYGFLMLTQDLQQSPPFLNLGYSAQRLYECICSYVSTDDCKEKTIEVLKRHNNALNIEISDDDYNLICSFKKGKNRIPIKDRRFVIPLRVMEKRGFKNGCLNKTIKELIAWGFIKVVCNDKARANNSNYSNSKFQFQQILQN